MVLNKELQVVNWNRHVLIVEDNKEVTRGRGKELLELCKNDKIPKCAFVRAVDIIKLGDERVGSLELTQPLDEGVDYLFIKIKSRN